MIILTGAKLEEFGKDVYGDIWLSMLARKLKRSKRTIVRWTETESGLPNSVRQALVDLIDEHSAVLGKWRSDLVSVWDDCA